MKGKGGNMPKYQVTYEDVVPSRTSSTKTKTIEAKDITEAHKIADNDSEVAWGYQRVVKVELYEDYLAALRKSISSSSSTKG